MRVTNIDSVAAAFQACTIPKSEWTHQMHLKIGAWHLHQYGKTEALEKLRTGIRQLNDSHGVPNSDSRGYHETITATYLQLIDTFFQQVGPSLSFDAALPRLLSSRIACRNFLLHFYSKDLLMSSHARREFVPPDIAAVQIPALSLSRSGDRPIAPWKNGKGWTSEISIFPTGATLDTFDWRVSIAGSETGGPFSSFPEIDRTLVILEGEIALSLDSAAPITLTPESEGLRFSGDSAATSTLIRGPLMDLNVMTRRGRFVQSVERRILPANAGIPLESGVTIVLAVESRDAWIFEQPCPETSPPFSPGDSFIICIDPV